MYVRSVDALCVLSDPSLHQCFILREHYSIGDGKYAFREETLQDIMR